MDKLQVTNPNQTSLRKIHTAIFMVELLII